MSTLIAMFGIGTTELMIIAGIMLLLFGHRLPGMMRSLGRGVTEFKRGVNEPLDEADDDDEEMISEKRAQKVDK